MVGVIRLKNVNFTTSATCLSFYPSSALCRFLDSYESATSPCVCVVYMDVSKSVSRSGQLCFLPPASLVSLNMNRNPVSLAVVISFPILNVFMWRPENY